MEGKKTMGASYFVLLESTFHTVLLLMLILTAILHLLMAAGVAKDVGYLQKQGAQPWFLPPFAWVLAVLLSGLWALGIYWLLHHSSLAR